MVAINDIGWGQYSGYEGPRYIGNKRFELPDNPTFEQKVMSVISASEGFASSINMYDRAIISVGFIQWIELNQYSVSDMIGYVAEKCGIELVNTKLRPALALSKATFKKTKAGKWRFHIAHPSTGAEVPVENEVLSRWLYAKGAGKVGTWTDMSKFWAKCWAAAIADLFEDEGAIAAQVEWTIPQLKSRFVLINGKKIVFEEGSSSEGYAGALKAFLMAYGVNLPAVAEKIIVAAAARSKHEKWSKKWCLDLIHDLALTSGVQLWPIRYNLKRAAVEKAFGIELPKTAFELSKRTWEKEQDAAPQPPVVVEQPKEPVEVAPVVEEPAPQPIADPSPPQIPEKIIEKQPSGLFGVITDFSNSILKAFRKK